MSPVVIGPTPNLGPRYAVPAVTGATSAVTSAVPAAIGAVAPAVSGATSAVVATAPALSAGLDPVTSAAVPSATGLTTAATDAAASGAGFAAEDSTGALIESIDERTDFTAAELSQALSTPSSGDFAVAGPVVPPPRNSDDDRRALAAFIQSGYAIETFYGIDGIYLARSFRNKSGQACREFVQVVEVGSTQVSARAIVCRTKDGSWQVMAPHFVGLIPVSER